MRLSLHAIRLTTEEVNSVFSPRINDIWKLKIDRIVREWLDENVRGWEYSWSGPDYLKSSTAEFRFMCDEDAVAFKLRWL